MFKNYLAGTVFKDCTGRFLIKIDEDIAYWFSGGRLLVREGLLDARNEFKTTGCEFIKLKKDLVDAIKAIYNFV